MIHCLATPNERKSLQMGYENDSYSDLLRDSANDMGARNELDNRRALIQGTTSNLPNPRYQSSSPGPVTWQGNLALLAVILAAVIGVFYAVKSSISDVSHGDYKTLMFTGLVLGVVIVIALAVGLLKVILLVIKKHPIITTILMGAGVWYWLAQASLSPKAANAPAAIQTVGNTKAPTKHRAPVHPAQATKPPTPVKE